MYTLLSLVDGGMMKFRLEGHVICPMFLTEVDALVFVRKHNISCRIEKVTVR